MFNLFLNELKKSFPKLKIKYKNESWLMTILAKILFFNQDFASGYITTIGNTVYFPTQESINKNELSAIATLAHEAVHIYDSSKYTHILFSLLYLLPQLLAILALPLYFVIGWWGLLALVFLAPWPAFFRKKFELNGYKMTLFMMNELYVHLGYDKHYREAELKELAGKIDSQNFQGSGYYFMWPFGVRNELNNFVDSVISGDILNSRDKDLEIFYIVKACFEVAKKQSTYEI